MLRIRSHVHRMPDCRLPGTDFNHRLRGKRDLGGPQMRRFVQFVPPWNRANEPISWTKEEMLMFLIAQED
jgi:hypothetical protein